VGSNRRVHGEIAALHHGGRRQTCGQILKRDRSRGPPGRPWLGEFLAVAGAAGSWRCTSSPLTCSMARRCTPCGDRVTATGASRVWAPRGTRPILGRPAGPDVLMDLGCRAERSSSCMTRDASCHACVRCRVPGAGIRVIRSAVQAPRMNSITERWDWQRRLELLDRTLIWNLRHRDDGGCRSTRTLPLPPRTAPGSAAATAGAGHMASPTGSFPVRRHDRVGASSTISPGGIGFRHLQFAAP